VRGPAARLLIICVAYALGATLVYLASAPGLDPIVPILFGAAAYVFTQDAGAAGGDGGGNVRYWRGRRVDDRDRSRWN
jgi:hypothetical protein